MALVPLSVSRQMGGESTPSRRKVLGALAAAGLTAGFSTVQAEDKLAAVQRLDFHHHFFASKALKKYLESYPNTQAGLDWSPATSLDVMDKSGISTAFLTVPVGLGDNPAALKAEAIAIARESNDFAAKLASDHKGRFGLFARLPLPDVDASLKEIEYACDTLKADGVGILSSYGGQYPGDRAFRPVFDELNRRKVVVHIHPTDPPGARALQSDTRPQLIEWPSDTGRAIWSVINDGEPNAPEPSLATRCANITFVWAHAGGTLLGLVGRLLVPDVTPEHFVKPPEHNSKLYHLRRFYYDTALTANPIQMGALKALVGASHIVFGSDSPFVPMTVIARGVEGCGFTAAELREIYRDNALKFLPKWK
jgi:6-methylsalicylate decarboxylase